MTVRRDGETGNAGQRYGMGVVGANKTTRTAQRKGKPLLSQHMYPSDIKSLPKRAQKRLVGQRGNYARRYVRGASRKALRS